MSEQARMPDSKRICFVSARTGHLQDPGNVKTDWANGRLITELQKRYKENLSLAMFSDPDVKGYDYDIACTKIYPLPYPFSYLGGLLNTIQLIRIFRQIEREHDILLVQLPIVGFAPLFFYPETCHFSSVCKCSGCRRQHTQVSWSSTCISPIGSSSDAPWFQIFVWTSFK